jgi:phosphatidylserine decarboxylase
MRSITIWLLIKLQNLLPKLLITRFVYKIARIKYPPIKNFLIKKFINLYKINTQEVEKLIPGDFATFNDFFIRELKKDARPISQSEKTVCSPVDGILTVYGDINEETLIQAKNHDYLVQDLVCRPKNEINHFINGQFSTIYLAPFNYHRVHSPIDGRIKRIDHIPGNLFSVNKTTTEFIPEVFAKNERVACYIEKDGVEIIVIFVGALNVGSISTPWTGEIKPKGRGDSTTMAFEKMKSTQIKKGDLLGWFNMGSTIIMIYPKDFMLWSDKLREGQSIQMGKSIGHLNNNFNTYEK